MQKIRNKNTILINKHSAIRLVTYISLILAFPVALQARISVNQPRSEDNSPFIEADAVIQKEDINDITDLSIDPTGKYLVTANTLGKIRLWDLNAGLLLRTYSDKSKEEQGTQVIMGPTGNYFLSHGIGGIKKWSLSENKVLQVFSESQFMGRIAVDTKGEILINANAPRLAGWSLRGNKQIPVMTDQHRFYGVFESLAVSSDGKYCFTGYADGVVAQWDLSTGRRIKEAQVHQNRVGKLLIDPTQRHLVSVAEDGSIVVWNVETLTVVRKIGLRPADIRNWTGRDHIHTGAIDAHGRFIATGGSQGHIDIWSFIDGRFIRRIEKPERGTPSVSSMAGITSLAFDPSGRILIAAGELGGIRLWDIKTGMLAKKLSGGGHRGYNQAINEIVKLPSTENKSHDLADSQRIVSVGKDLKYIVAKTNKDELNVWDVGSLRMLLHFDEKTHVTHCILDPQGRYAVTGTRQNSMGIYDLRTGSLLRKLQPALRQQKIASLQIDPAGKTIISIHVGTAPFPKNLSVKTLTAWDLESGNLLFMVNGCDKALIDPKGRYVAGVVDDNRITMWNLKTGAPLRTIKLDRGFGGVFDIIQEGKLVVIGYPEHSLYFWDVDTGAQKIVSPEGDEAQKSVEIDETGQYIIYSVYQRLFGQPHRYYAPPRPNDRSISYTSATVRSVSTGKIVCRIDGHRNEITAVEVDPTGRYAISASDDKIGIWDLKTGRLAHAPKVRYSVGKVAVDQSGNYLAAASIDSMLSIWNIRTGELIKTVSGINPPLRLSIMNENPLSAQPIIVSTTKDNMTTLIELLSGKKLQVGGFGSDNRISPDQIVGDYILSDTAYNGITLWNVKKGHNVTLVSSGKEWLVWSSDGYFDSSRNGGSIVNMVSGMSAFGVDQFAIKNNRPDIMLRELGLGSDELIAHFYGLYRKRLRKSGFAEKELSSELHVPEAKILNAAQNGNIVKITYALRDSKYNLKKFNIYVNDVPLYGAFGKEIAGKSVTGTEQVELTKGKNKLEVTCINEKGAESYRALTYAEGKSEIKGDLYYLGFGVSRYQDPNLNLRYADKDAHDLAGVFGRMKEHFKTVHTRLSVNEEVTAATIKGAKAFLKNANWNDTVVLFVAGHGLHDRDKDATYYYLTYNARLDNLAATAAPFDLIEDVFQNIAPRKKILLLDTCESGDLDDTLQNTYIASAQRQGIQPRTARAIRVSVPATIGPHRAFVYDKNRYIYNDVSRRTGAVVFSSSQGTEFSYESDKISNGFFTRELIAALTSTKADKNGDGVVSKDELETYVINAVSKLSNDLQHPSADRDTIYQKIDFPVRQIRPGSSESEVGKSTGGAERRAGL